MTELNRILALAGLRRLDEMFSRNPAVNGKIEAVLDTMPKDAQTRASYMLDVLHSAGPTGLTPADWMAQADDAYGGKLPRAEFSSLIKALPFCVKRLESGRYVWNEGNSQGAEFDALAGQQIKLTQEALAFLKDRDAFTMADLKGYLSGKGVPPQVVGALADHMVNQFGGLLQNLGGGRMRMTKEPSWSNDDSMSMLRDIAHRAGDGPSTA